jgi:hypothetical protein
MRNLSLLSVFSSTFPNTLAEGKLSAIAVDVDNKILYGTVERITHDGQLEIAVWKFEVNLTINGLP